MQRLGVGGVFRHPVTLALSRMNMTKIIIVTAVNAEVVLPSWLIGFGIARRPLEAFSRNTALIVPHTKNKNSFRFLRIFDFWCVGRLPYWVCMGKVA